MVLLQRRRNTGILCALALLGIAYSTWLYYEPTITGMDLGDGIIGVVLGLYICSHPAANWVDILFFSRRSGRRFSSRWSAVSWLVLNTLILLIGGMVIFIGTTRLVERD